MDLLFFKMLKRLSKKGGSPYSTFLKHVPHVIPSELVVEQSDRARRLSVDGKTNAEIHSSLVSSIPFSDMWIELLEGSFQLTDNLQVAAVSIHEVVPDKDYAIWALTNAGDLKFLMTKDDDDGTVGASMIELMPNDQYGISESAESDFLAPLLVSFSLYCVAAIVHKENQIGTARASRLIRGSVRPYEISYIRRKKSVSLSPKSYQIPQNVVWHHSWRVSGCWVRIKGVGKDRNGNRTVKGLTWRIPHVKGSGPLIEKIRVMIPEKQLQKKIKADTGD